MQHEYRAAWFRDCWAVEWYETDGAGGKVRRRKSLGTTDRNKISSLVAAFAAEREREQARSTAMTVEVIWDAYRAAMAGRPTAEHMRHEWKSIGPHFGSILAADLRQPQVDDYIDKERVAGRKEWTIYGKLNHLRNALSWAAKQKMIAEAPHLSLPPTPPPRDLRLTREQARLFLAHCKQPHIALFVKLALGTAGRMDAILGLTWDRVDFEYGRIDLRDKSLPRTAKNRAMTGMPDFLREALVEAQPRATCPFVVEYGGNRIGSVKKTIGRVASDCGLPWVSAHVFRHTAASWMAIAGVPIEEIAQYLGHKDPRVTFKVYARFMPDFQSRATRALQDAM